MSLTSPSLLTLADVQAWITELYDAGFSFHPDTPGVDYVTHATGERCFTDREAERFDCARARADEVCDAAGTDIYTVGLLVLTVCEEAAA